MRHTRMLTFSLAALVALIVGATSPETWAAKKKLELEISRIYWEYNSSANDLGVHVSLDGEDWRKLKIINPAGRTIFEVEGRGPYRMLGLTAAWVSQSCSSRARSPTSTISPSRTSWRGSRRGCTGSRAAQSMEMSSRAPGSSRTPYRPGRPTSWRH